MTDKEYQHALDLMEKGIRADERAKMIGEIRPLVDEAIRTMEVKYVYDITKVLAKYEKEQANE